MKSKTLALATLLIVTVFLLMQAIAPHAALAGTTWNKVNTNGFGSANNFGAVSTTVFGSYLYVGTVGPPAAGGCQVWRSSNGTTWNKVNTSGFGDPNNYEADSMCVMGSYLYVGTGNTTTGCQVWRSSNGTAWSKVSTGGFGVVANSQVDSMSVFGSDLYVGTGPAGMGSAAAQIWRSSNGTAWNQVNASGSFSANSGGALSMSVFGSYLYVGTGNGTTGCQVWRSSNGTAWSKVGTGGFGDANNFWAVSTTVFGSYLYVGTDNVNEGGQVWRSSNGTTWNKVSTGGFGDTKNRQILSMSVLGSYLYAGTENLTTGCQVWRSSNGTTWNKANTNGFGDANNIDARSMTVLGSDLYVGTFNGNTGCEVWRYSSPSAFYFAEGTTRTNFQEYLCLGNSGNTAASAQVTYMFTDGTTKDANYTVPANSRYTVDVNSVVGPNEDVSLDVLADSPNLVAERPMYFNYNGVWTGGSDALGAVAPNNNWYFAEGNTLPEFDEYVTVLNPGNTAANLTFHYMVEGTGEKDIGGSVGAHSRATFTTRDQIGSNLTGVSLYLSSNEPVVAERPIYFNYQGLASNNWTGGHDVVGTNSPAKDWYFAEGTTRKNSVDGAFEQWLTLQNPGSSAITVNATYQLGPNQGNPIIKSYAVPAEQRLTVSVNNEMGPNKDDSVFLSSTGSFIAERPMYFNYHNVWTGGHDVLGAKSTAKTWYFAEGTTRTNFDEWLTLQNPGDTDAHTTISYYTASGQVITKQWTVKANTRLTVSANSDVGPNQDISAKIVSDQPIIAERPTYFNYNGVWTGGHDVVGFVPAQ